MYIIGRLDIMSAIQDSRFNSKEDFMRMSKALVFAAAIASCTALSAGHHGKPHKPGTKICRECDGRGKVRTWKRVWLKWRDCRECGGRGYFVVKPVVKPVPVKPGPKHPPKKPHVPGPVRGHDERPKGKH